MTSSGHSVVRRLLARLGAAALVTGVALGLLAGPAGATTGRASPPPELAATLQQLAVELGPQAIPVLVEMERSLRTGQPISPETEALAIRLVQQGAPRLQAVLDQLAAQRAPGLVALEQATDAPGCAPHPVETDQGAKGSYLRREGNRMIATITVEAPLCQPVPLSLKVFSKPGARPWPAPQRFEAEDRATIQAPGTTELAVDLPTTAAGDVVCAQVDLIRGVVGLVGLPGIVDFLQLDALTDGCVAPEVLEAATTAGEVEVAGATLPATGPATVGPAAVVGAVAIALGWLLLCTRALACASVPCATRAL